MKVEGYNIEKRFFNRKIHLTLMVKKGKKIEDPEIKKLLEHVNERTPLKNNGDFQVWHRMTFDLKRKDQRLGIEDCNVTFDEIKDKGYFVSDPLFEPQSCKDELLDLLERAAHIIKNMGEGEPK